MPIKYVLLATWPLWVTTAAILITTYKIENPNTNCSNRKIKITKIKKRG